MPSVLDTLNRPSKSKRAYARQHPLDRIRAQSRPDPLTGCLVWQGRPSNRGYGYFTISQAGYPTISVLAHRAAFELAYGRIPVGLVVDHLCRNRLCVNPDHLEAVTQRTNTLRSPVALGAQNAAKTHCPRGHAYSPENTYTYRPKNRRTTVRICRACAREQARARKAAS